MKISFAFVLSSLLRSSHYAINPFHTSCYAVVNLLFAFHQKGFRSFRALSPSGLWWAQMDFLLFGCFATKWHSSFAPISCEIWWAQMDSDHRPHAYQACALTSWAMSPYGGGNRVRTDDPLLAGQVLYQLSYTPSSFSPLLAKINAPLS